MVTEFAIWLFLFVILSSLILVLEHWIDLFQKQDSYHRDELLDIFHILRRKWILILGDASRLPSGLLLLLIGISTAWLLTMVGGLLSQDISPAPDHASDQISNYFFQSFTFVLLHHVTWPALYSWGKSSQLILFDWLTTKLELAFSIGLTLSLGTISLMLWGLYHETSFLYASSNLFICLSYVSYRLSMANAKKGKASQEKPEP